MTDIDMEMDTVAVRLKQICAIFQITMEAADQDEFDSDPERHENLDGFNPEVLNEMFSKRVRSIYFPALNAICGSLEQLHEQVQKSMEVSQ